MPTLPTQIAFSGQTYTDALLWGGWKWNDAAAAPGSTTVITYYLDTYQGNVWNAAAAAGLARAFQTWSDVANISFVQVSTPDAAQLIERLVSDARLPGALGEHGTPESAMWGDSDGALILGANNQAFGYFNYDLFSPGGFGRGGYDLLTFVHELGHGIGLAHPHDDGGGSGVFPGVTGFNDSDLGANNLNQGLYTAMSYNDGWALAQNPAGAGLTRYGYESGPMAFDIAAIQYLYGANTTAHSGNDVYALPGVNAAGTAWSCLWDTGGIDTIIYGGARNVVINLTAATLDNSATGGGVASYAKGIYGGYTIANGVVIENASTGRGKDVIIGNGADNVLAGAQGNDILRGGAGQDSLFGGRNKDKLFGGADADTFYFAAFGNGNVDHIGDFQSGIDRIYLNHNLFANAGAVGALIAEAFHAGRGAAEFDDHIIYRQATGDLTYDSNGRGFGGAHVFAHLNPGTALAASDFYIF